jgi:hypothetical protein
MPVLRITLLFSAKNEVFHLCAEAEETGDRGPSLDDVISMVLEDVLNQSLMSTLTETSGWCRRALQHARVMYTTIEHARMARSSQGNRALRVSHPSSVFTPHRHATRSHHLRYNHFTRPRRQLRQDHVISELLDSLSIRGGYDGSQIFLKVKMDVSKESVNDLDSLILQPLQLLDNTDFLPDLNILSGSSSETSISIDTDLSFLAGAHLEATGELSNVLQPSLSTQE